MTNARQPGQPPAGQEHATVGQVFAAAAASMLGIGVALILIENLKALDAPAAPTSTWVIVGRILVGLGVLAALAGGVLIVRERKARAQQKTVTPAADVVIDHQPAQLKDPVSEPAGPDEPAPRRALPEVPGAVIVVVALLGWATRWATGWVHQFGWLLLALALLLLAVPTINKALSDDSSWLSRAIRRARAIPRPIQFLVVGVTVLTAALCAFLWAIGVQVDVGDVVRDNRGVVVTVGFLLAVIVAIWVISGGFGKKSQVNDPLQGRDQSE